MRNYKFDVVIIGAGPAGVAAAGGLAESGLSVAIIEAGVYAGAENWSGCVYFAENLAEPDCFGPAAVQNAPFERSVIRRGTLMHNGLDVVGLSLTDPSVFRHCYTVLRPVFDPYFAGLAKAKGAMLFPETTAVSLIRKSGRIVGASTNRGLVYADVVFLAEGDASHLVRSEGLERIAEPHFLQGVKAVLSLPAEEINERFNLRTGEGAAFEVIVRNPTVGGKTARLNIGAFLYTNKNSLSLGYVVPLDNLKRSFHGNHDRLLEWLRGLPWFKDLTEGAELSAYGAKLIRSGGWRERPVLVEDGLAVGGASAGFGVDIPFPNFTGPASATGLFFARAVKAMLMDAKPFSAKNLAAYYLEPLRTSVYGQNAHFLSHWPKYFSRSSVLFGRAIDITCGGARFLKSKNFLETGRFFRKHLLSVRGLTELVSDAAAAFRALQLTGTIIKTIASPKTFAAWTLNMFRRIPEQNRKIDFVFHIDGEKTDSSSFPGQFKRLIRRISPAIAAAADGIYANDGIPAEKKFKRAVAALVRSLRMYDIVAIPFYAAYFFSGALFSALWDSFRFYLVKVPADTFLAEPAMAYQNNQRKTRDLDNVESRTAFEAKLAANTYRIGEKSHIRTVWPQSPAKHPDMSQASLWWICPARVYGYDAPLAGRGKVTVNWENCIKCESCWRSEPRFALWGRFTEHKLIYRPDTSAITLLLSYHPGKTALPKMPLQIEDKLWYADPSIVAPAKRLLNSITAFRNAVYSLPASASRSRMRWPFLLGERVCVRLNSLEKAFFADSRQDAAASITEERKNLERQLQENRFFHALYTVIRIEQLLQSWFGDMIPAPKTASSFSDESSAVCEEAAKLFPSQIVKRWEEEPVPEEWTEKLRGFVMERLDQAPSVVRALSGASPALGFIAACQIRSAIALKNAGRAPVAGLNAVEGHNLSISTDGEDAIISGMLNLVPTTAAKALFIISNAKGYIIPLSDQGVALSSTPTIGFRAAGLSDVVISCRVPAENIVSVSDGDFQSAWLYLAIALGAGDYLSHRVQEHAQARVQFSGQMIDTEGRDGIAKLGAVKAMIARVEAWRLLLETLFDSCLKVQTPSPLFSMVCAAAASMAFSPENGAIAYDAGQVFGGFAYSEDDLISRFYRDSSVFRFLMPGRDSANALISSFDTMNIEKAVSAELGSLNSSTDKPLDTAILAWRKTARAFSNISASADPKPAGEAAALLLAIRALLLRTEKNLEQGHSCEAEAGAIEVLLGLAEDAVLRAKLSAGRGAVSPDAVFPIGPDQIRVSLDLDYETFCALSAAPYRSGLFLISVFDRSPRYVPEMQLHDKELRSLWEKLGEWFKNNCRDRSFGGLSFERYVEKTHSLPPDIIEAVIKNRWLATYIPKELGGLGWRKAMYYVLNSSAGSFGDAAVCLLIMASTSIGTTPILLGLEDELPRVREELEPLLKDKKHLGEIGERIGKIIASFASPDPAGIRKQYQALMRLVDSRIRRTRVLKYLAANFLRNFYSAGAAGQRADFSGFGAHIKKAQELFERLIPDVQAAVQELPRRERCHKLYLRTLGNGGVAAFALTEPTAGSDSGGVKTTARLSSAMLSPMPDGRYAFSPTGESDKCLRYLIDADKITFIESGMAYITPDGTPAPIKYDRYDYAANTGVRYYEYRGAICDFHDIGQLRQTDKGPVYEYYLLSGAKMWITNGSIATQFSLFAQTAEGVTGFIVDRHAEGLKVGADEKKTGQRGSPTNEIALDNVRVPREAVIGYEGHGQVNALETLNVGRCGLAVVAGALARKVLQEARQAIPPSLERDRLLGEAAAILFGSESLAYYLIGLFDRPHESVRMESAIAKFICSEDIHKILSLVEQALGPASQTERFLIEKARRDARILNIYEGTNEVQRFLVLKDLVSMASNWPKLPEKLHERPFDNRAAALAAWKNRLRQHIHSAADILGDAAWSDAMLQPAMFILAEMAGEILRLECIWHRMEWLEHRQAALGKDYVEPLLAAGNRAAVRAIAHLEHKNEKYNAAWKEIASSLNPVEVRTADALLSRTAQIPLEKTNLNAAGRILVVLRPAADLSPNHKLAQGQLKEIVWKLDRRDRACLDQALALRSESTASNVDVLLAGAAGHENLLSFAAAGADRFFRLDCASSAPPEIAAAIRELEKEGRYNLIMCGSQAEDGGADLGAYLAGFLNRNVVYTQSVVGFMENNQADHIIVTLTADVPESKRMIGPLIESQTRKINVLSSRDVAPSTPFFSIPIQTKAIETKTVTTVIEAADYIKTYAAALETERFEAFTGHVESGNLPSGTVVWAIVDPRSGKANTAALRAAQVASKLFGIPACALIAAPTTHWTKYQGLVRANGVETAYCIDTRNKTLSREGMHAVLKTLFSAEKNSIIFAGHEWNEGCGFFAGKLAADKKHVRFAANASMLQRNQEGYLDILIPAYEGKLLRNERIGDAAAIITFSADADIPPADSVDLFRVVVVDLELKSDWLEDIPASSEQTLSTAEVIIDLGYGIRDRAGLELAKALRQKLKNMGLSPLLGATRKVTQDLKLLPLEAQIGQTGVRVNPKLIIAMGISGAPQHIDYLGTRAEILVFNKDPEAPLMKLNQTRSAPHVHPIAGDLFMTVKELIERLG